MVMHVTRSRNLPCDLLLESCKINIALLGFGGLRHGARSHNARAAAQQQQQPPQQHVNRVCHDKCAVASAMLANCVCHDMSILELESVCSMQRKRAPTPAGPSWPRRNCNTHAQTRTPHDLQQLPRRPLSHPLRIAQLSVHPPCNHGSHPPDSCPGP